MSGLIDSTAVTAPGVIVFSGYRPVPERTIRGIFPIRNGSPTVHSTDRVGEFATVSGRLFAAIADLHVGDLRMFAAVRLSGRRFGIAEAEARRAGLADWPAARDPAHRSRRNCTDRGGFSWPERPAEAVATGRASWPNAQAAARGAAAPSGGSVGPVTRCGCGGRGETPGIPSRRIGEGTGRQVQPCALPTTAFFDIPIRRPISAVECPSDQSIAQPRDHLVVPLHI